MIILDFGSGNTCKNDFSYIEKMTDKLAEVDKDRQCIIKWQLFQEAGSNIPLQLSAFNYAYKYAEKFGFQTTASIFDLESLDFLLHYDIPFIKIANRPDVYWLIRKIPREIKVIVSHSGLIFPNEKFYIENYLSCISKYPANRQEYENQFGIGNLKSGISDHTTNWDLYNEYKPEVYECHYKLEDSTGLDAGEFARTPEQLKEIL